MVLIVNPRAVKPHKEAGDWGARWLASNEAGSGAYQLMPSTYMPLEHADLEKYHDQLPEDFRSSRKNDRTGRRVDCALYDPTEAVGA